MLNKSEKKYTSPQAIFIELDLGGTILEGSPISGFGSGSDNTNGGYGTDMNEGGW